MAIDEDKLELLLEAAGISERTKRKLRDANKGSTRKSGDVPGHGAASEDPREIKF